MVLLWYNDKLLIYRSIHLLFTFPSYRIKSKFPTIFYLRDLLRKISWSISSFKRYSNFKELNKMKREYRGFSLHTIFKKLEADTLEYAKIKKKMKPLNPENLFKNIDRNRLAEVVIRDYYGINPHLFSASFKKYLTEDLLERILHNKKLFLKIINSIYKSERKELPLGGPGTVLQEKELALILNMAPFQNAYELSLNKIPIKQLLFFIIKFIPIFCITYSPLIRLSFTIFIHQEYLVKNILRFNSEDAIMRAEPRKGRVTTSLIETGLLADSLSNNGNEEIKKMITAKKKTLTLRYYYYKIKLFSNENPPFCSIFYRFFTLINEKRGSPSEKNIFDSKMGALITYWHDASLEKYTPEILFMLLMISIIYAAIEEEGRNIALMLMDMQKNRWQKGYIMGERVLSTIFTIIILMIIPVYLIMNSTIFSLLKEINWTVLHSVVF